MNSTTAAPAVAAGVAAARLAPSAHNSQPWRFQPSGGDLLVRWDPGRELPHGDPHGHYLLTGLGAAAESLALGAAGAGQPGEVAFDFDPAGHRAGRVHLAAGTPGPGDLELAAAVPWRRTARVPFATTPVPAAALDRLARAAGRHGCQLAIVAGRRAVGEVAALVGEGTAGNFADPEVFAEFHGWLRAGRDPRATRDGLPLAALGLGPASARLAPWALEPGRMRRLSRLGLHRAAARTQARLARRCPAFGLLTTWSGEPEALFGGGRALLRLWLEATALGLRLHPMTAAMDHESTRTALARAFGVPAGASMVASFRIGKAAAPPPAAKLPATELLDPAVTKEA